jgi:hypothetical protein
MLRGFAVALAIVALVEARAEVSGGYMHAGPTEIDYLTITKTGSKLSGYVQAVTLDLRQSTGYRADKPAFEGDIDGSNFLLHSGWFSSGLGQCSGKVTSHGIRLMMPLSNGQTSTVDFERAGTEAWNKAVSKFQAKCGHAKTADLLQRAFASYVEEKKKEHDKAASAVPGLTTQVEKDQARLKKANEGLDRANAKLAKAEEALAAAEDEAARLNTSEARYKVSDRRYEVSAARYDINSANYDVKDATRDLERDQKELQDNKDVLSWNEAEAEIMSSCKPYVERLWAGTLLLALPEKSGAITRRPREGSTVFYNYKVGERFVVLPISDDWCMVYLQNGNLGWARRGGLKLKNY